MWNSPQVFSNMIKVLVAVVTFLDRVAYFSCFPRLILPLFPLRFQPTNFFPGKLPAGTHILFFQTACEMTSRRCVVGKPVSEKKHLYYSLTLVGPSRDNLVLDPLAVLHLDNRLFMNQTLLDIHKWRQTNRDWRVSNCIIKEARKRPFWPKHLDVSISVTSLITALLPVNSTWQNDAVNDTDYTNTLFFH